MYGSLENLWQKYFIEMLNIFMDMHLHSCVSIFLNLAAASLTLLFSVKFVYL